MRFRLQQLGLFAIAAILQAYPIWQGLSSQEGTADLPVLVTSIWMSAFSGVILAFVAFRGLAWALWSPKRSRMILTRSGLTEANVISGRSAGFWRWFLDVDKNGQPRDA